MGEKMRPVRKITKEEEGVRIVSGILKQNPVKPEPVGTIVLLAFRVTGYSPDCDGSLMATVEHIDKDGETTGWKPDPFGLDSDSELVVTPEELKGLFVEQAK